MCHGNMVAEFGGNASGLFLPIEVGTPVAPDAPLADPGVRNYRTGIIRASALLSAFVKSSLNEWGQDYTD